VRVTTTPDLGNADDLDFGLGPSTAAAELGEALDQSAIDDRLRGQADARAVQTGARALLSAGGVREERLPILEMICDRVVRSLSTNLRRLTSRVFDVRWPGSTPRALASRWTASPYQRCSACFAFPNGTMPG
jgi:flagellar motor switch protein FliM